MNFKQQGCCVKLLLGLVFILVSTQVFAEDAPNVGKETVIHDHYKTYHDVPTDENLWFVISRSTGVQSYKTQKGETLWDVSETIFGDGNFWTKIWAVNASKVTNPYDVKPGTVLTFYPGSLDEPPAFKVKWAQANPIDTDVLALYLGAELPPPQKEYVPLIKDLPGSFPFWNYRQEISLKPIMELTQVDRNFSATNEVLRYFIKDGRIEAEGEIVGIEAGSRGASDYQYVFAKVTGDFLKRTFVLQKDIGEIKDIYSKKKARLVQVQAIVKLEQEVDKSRLIYRAVVLKAFNTIEVGAKLVPLPLPTYNTNFEREPEDAMAVIIGGPNGENQKLHFLRDLVYLNRGSEDGLEVGQELRVYKDQKYRSDQSFNKDYAPVVGRLKVVNTSLHFSTAVLTEMKEDIYTGDASSPEVFKRRIQ